MNSDGLDTNDQLPADLLADHIGLFTDRPLEGPVLDLASGDCRNGIFLARHNLKVVCCDVSPDALARGRRQAAQEGVPIDTWQVDLEGRGENPFPEESYGGIVVFRYLHRPLISCIKKALRSEGILLYETYTTEQPQFGKPTNPAFLLQPGELRDWFAAWDVLHYFEGIRYDPPRAVAQIVCRKRLAL